MSAPFVQIDQAQVSENLLAEVEVHQQLNRHWTCRVRYRATQDARPAVHDLQGKSVRIATVDLTGIENLIFTGIVVQASLTDEVWGSYTAEIEAVSTSWLMDRSPRFHYFRKQAPTAIAATLGSPYSLSVQGSIAGDANLSRVQWGESDYRFLLRLIDDGEAWVRPAETGLETFTVFQSGPTLPWREGEYGLLELTTHGRLRPLNVQGAHYDPNVMISATYTTQTSNAATFGSAPQMVSASLKSNPLPDTYITSRSRSATQADYQQRLQMEARRRKVSAVEVTGTSRSPEVKAGNLVTLTGIPQGSETYGVVECTHLWNVKGYENHFRATPATRWLEPERVQAPEIEGLYPARVVDHNDPHNQGRIRVQYLWQEDSETSWVRWLTPHAGPDRGLVMLPELGDEVLIGFEQGDPERPIAIGAAWNGVHTPPTEGFWTPGQNGPEYQNNELKRLVTKSGHRFTLSDNATQPSISLSTPRSARLLLTDKDNETGTPSIAFQTSGDILIVAPHGRIHMKSDYISREVSPTQT